MKVSVVMPVFNAELYVQPAIESVLSQANVPFELIVVDDGSTDRSLSIISQTNDPRLTVISQPNEGYAHAMNAGIAIARGEYIARMDSDDLSKLGRLSSQADFLDTHEDYVMVGTMHNVLSPSGVEVPSRMFNSESFWSDQTWQMLIDGTRTFADPSVMFRTEHARKVGGYRTYQRSGMDLDLWLRLLETGMRAAVLNQPLYLLRIGVETITSHPQVYARNQIPRLLAKERQSSGIDRVDRGEEIDDLISGELLRSSHAIHIRQQWFKAAVCFRAADWQFGLRFTWIALRRGGIGPGNLKHLLSIIQIMVKSILFQLARIFASKGTNR